MTIILGLLVAVSLMAIPSAAAAETVLACEHPGGGISITRFRSPDLAKRQAVAEKLRMDGRLPAAAACWEMDGLTLPARQKADPREPLALLSQRHQWRRAGQVIFIDPTVKRPQVQALRREYGRLIPPARWAEIMATSLGSALDRAVREGRWADVRAILDQTGPAQPLTTPEIAQFRAILRDYEAD